MKPTQQQRMIDFARANGFITSLDGLKLGITDIAGQVQAMKKKGIAWTADWNDGRHYKKYSLRDKK